MRTDTIERRRDPRTQASIQIRLHFHDTENLTTAHLIDLSSSGAAFVTATADRPTIGQYVDLIFEREPLGASVARHPRRQTAIVVNLHTPDPGVQGRCRVGVRFMEGGESDCELLDPIDDLSDYRRGFSIPDPLRKWETARHFQVAHGLNGPRATPSRKPATVPV